MNNVNGLKEDNGATVASNVVGTGAIAGKETSGMPVERRGKLKDDISAAAKDYARRILTTKKGENE